MIQNHYVCTCPHNDHVVFAERDILVLSTTTPIKNLLSIFTDCLKLRACVRQEGVIVLSSEPNAVTPIQVSITPVSKQAECTVQAADEAALTNVMHILTKNLPKGRDHTSCH